MSGPIDPAGMGGADGPELVRVAGGPLEIEVLPSIGARLHRLRAFGHDLLRTPHDLRPHTDDPYFYGSYPMAPWCNRVPAGPGFAAGHPIDLPATFPDGTAIHGQVSRRPWQVVERRPDEAAFRIAGGGDGWPWRYVVDQRVAVVGTALQLELRLTNRADDPMPGGIGFHPWFLRPLEVRIDAAAVHPSNLATEAEPVPVTGAFDRRRLEPMPDGLDATWADLSQPPVVLAWTETGVRATLTTAILGGSSIFITAASPPGTDAVAVEPQTHAPDALRRLARSEPGGPTMIPPGGVLELQVTLAFEQVAPMGRAPAQKT